MITAVSNWWQLAVVTGNCKRSTDTWLPEGDDGTFKAFCTLWAQCTLVRIHKKVEKFGIHEYQKIWYAKS